MSSSCSSADTSDDEELTWEKEELEEELAERLESVAPYSSTYPYGSHFPNYIPRCNHSEMEASFRDPKETPRQVLCFHSWRNDLLGGANRLEMRYHPAVTQPQKVGRTVLLTLPMEILDQILGYVLCQGKITVMENELHIRQPSFKGNWKREWQFGTYHIMHSQLTWSFLICKCLYHRQVEIFYGQNAFDFSSFQQMARFLYGIGPQRRKFIRNVTIYDDASYTQKLRPHEQYFKQAWSLLGESTNIRTLVIRFEKYLAPRNRRSYYYTENDEIVHHPTQKGKLGQVGPDRKAAAVEWKWPYATVRSFDQLQGLSILKEFRGVEKFVVLVRRSTQQMTGGAVNRVRALIKSPKPAWQEATRIPNNPRKRIHFEEENQSEFWDTERSFLENCEMDAEDPRRLRSEFWTERGKLVRNYDGRRNQDMQERKRTKYCPWDHNSDDEIESGFEDGFARADGKNPSLRHDESETDEEKDEEEEDGDDDNGE